MVVVIGTRETGRQASLVERLLRACQVLGPPATNGHRAVMTVELAAEVQVVLQGQEMRQDFRPRPLRITGGDPRLEVVWNTPDRDRVPDRGCAAGHFGLEIPGLA